MFVAVRAEQPVSKRHGRHVVMRPDSRSSPSCPLPGYRFDEAAEQRALDAQAQHARVGHHRLPPVDLLIAALADRHGLGILHYDRNCDQNAE